MYYLFMEVCEGGDLFDAFANAQDAEAQDRVTETTISNVMLQAVSAVAFLHKRGVAHRAISLEKFLLKKRTYPSEKIP